MADVDGSGWPVELPLVAPPSELGLAAVGGRGGSERGRGAAGYQGAEDAGADGGVSG